MNSIKSILLLTTLLTLTACGSTRYNGKIIPGTVGRPIIVQTTDDRINNHQGIPGLEVTLYNESSRGRAPVQLSKTITDEDGKFAFSIPSANTPRGAVIVRVTGDQIYSARSKAFLPRGGQLMLFTVVTRKPMMDPDTQTDDTSANVDPSK
ncbi:MAG: hypothetical protein JKY43_06925 [Phycisphaerales bacterium]|nr:hypothetical protein [Phycisphaerales bacterium]